MATETSAQPGDFKLTTTTNPIFDNVTITDTNTDPIGVIADGTSTVTYPWPDTPTSHNDIDTVKTHVQIAPNVYLQILDEGGRAMFHLCENLRDNLAGEFLPEYYKKNKKGDSWQYYNYKCNKCGVMIPDELTNKADVMGQLAKFKTNNG